MLFDGMVDETGLGITKVQDHWKETTSTYIEQYWEKEENKSTFSFSEVNAKIEKIDTILTRKLQTVIVGEGSKQKIRRESEVWTRLIYQLEFTYRGSEATIIPEEVLLTPLDQEYVGSLKQSNDTSISGVFESVFSVQTKLSDFVQPGPEPTGQPTVQPTEAPETPEPTPSPVADVSQLEYNEESEATDVVNIVLIAGLSLLAAISIGVILKPRRTPAVAENDNEDDEEQNNIENLEENNIENVEENNVENDEEIGRNDESDAEGDNESYVENVSERDEENKNENVEDSEKNENEDVSGNDEESVDKSEDESDENEA